MSMKWLSWKRCRREWSGRCLAYWAVSLRQADGEIEMINISSRTIADEMNTESEKPAGGEQLHVSKSVSLAYDRACRSRIILSIRWCHHRVWHEFWFTSYMIFMPWSRFTRGNEWHRGRRVRAWYFIISLITMRNIGMRKFAWRGDSPIRRPRDYHVDMTTKRATTK